MHPFSLLESGDSNGSVSLASLFSGGNDDVHGSNPMEIDRLAFLCCKGGWPEVCIGRKRSDRAALMVARSYVDAVCSSEMDTDDGVVRPLAGAFGYVCSDVVGFFFLVLRTLFTRLIRPEKEFMPLGTSRVGKLGKKVA